MDQAESEEQQARFVELLAELSTRGAVTWAASDEPGFVACLVGDDLIDFELQGGSDARHVAASEEVHGITARCRNVSYHWLEAVAGWDGLLALLRAAPCSREAFYRIARHVRGLPVAVLEHYLRASDFQVDAPADRAD